LRDVRTVSGKLNKKITKVEKHEKSTGFPIPNPCRAEALNYVA